MTTEDEEEDNVLVAEETPMDVGGVIPAEPHPEEIPEIPGGGPGIPEIPEACPSGL